MSINTESILAGYSRRRQSMSEAMRSVTQQVAIKTQQEQQAKEQAKAQKRQDIIQGVQAAGSIAGQIQNQKIKEKEQAMSEEQFAMSKEKFKQDNELQKQRMKMASENHEIGKKKAIQDIKLGEIKTEEAVQQQNLQKASMEATVAYAAEKYPDLMKQAKKEGWSEEKIFAVTKQKQEQDRINRQEKIQDAELKVKQASIDATKARTAQSWADYKLRKEEVAFNRALTGDKYAKEALKPVSESLNTYEEVKDNPYAIYRKGDEKTIKENDINFVKFNSNAQAIKDMKYKYSDLGRTVLEEPPKGPNGTYTLEQKNKMAAMISDMNMTDSRLKKIQASVVMDAYMNKVEGMGVLSDQETAKLEKSIAGGDFATATNILESVLEYGVVSGVIANIKADMSRPANVEAYFDTIGERIQKNQRDLVNQWNSTQGFAHTPKAQRDAALEAFIPTTNQNQEGLQEIHKMSPFEQRKLFSDMGIDLKYSQQMIENDTIAKNPSYLLEKTQKNLSNLSKYQSNNPTIRGALESQVGMINEKIKYMKNETKVQPTNLGGSISDSNSNIKNYPTNSNGEPVKGTNGVPVFVGPPKPGSSKGGTVPTQEEQRFFGDSLIGL